MDGKESNADENPPDSFNLVPMGGMPKTKTA